MNNGAFGENFPYSNFHDLNMDWIIKIAKDFLDQYTHIQDVIAQGLIDLDNKTTEGLTALEDKFANLQSLLDAWYQDHSEDIANQLADALEDLNQALATNTAEFYTRAEHKGQEVLDSIPSDYTELSEQADMIQNVLFTENILDFVGLDNPTSAIQNGITFTHNSDKTWTVSGTLNSGSSEARALLYSGALPPEMKIGETYFVKFYSESLNVMFAIEFYNSSNTRIDAIWPRRDRQVTVPAGTATMRLWLLVESHDPINETVKPELLKNYPLDTISKIAKTNLNMYTEYTIGHIGTNGEIQDDVYIFLRTGVVDGSKYRCVTIKDASNITLEWFQYDKNNNFIVWQSITLTQGRTFFLDPNYNYRFQIRHTNNAYTMANRYDLITEMLTHIVIYDFPINSSARGFYDYPKIIYGAGHIDLDGTITNTNRLFIYTGQFIDLNYYNCIWVDNGYTAEVFRYNSDGTLYDFTSIESDTEGGRLYIIEPSNYKYRIQIRLTENYVPLTTDALVEEMITHLSIFHSPYLQRKLAPSATTWNAVGDSITYLGQYMEEVAKLIPINYRNEGLGSCTLALNNTYLANQSIVERVCGLNGNTAIPDADIWTIQGGLNDVLYHSTLGSLAPIGTTYDITTVYGALQTMCEHVLNLRAVPKLILMTPTHSPRDYWTEEEYGITIAQIRKAMMDVGELYAIPVIDMWSVGELNNYNSTKPTNPTTSDGLHPNSTGAKLIAMPIASAIKNF